MSHGDSITATPQDFVNVGSTADVRNAAFRIAGEETWGVQFHPEVYHSEDGLKVLGNFVVGICGSKQDWTPQRPS